MFAIACALATSIGCDAPLLEDLCEAVALCDEPAPPAHDLFVLCDLGGGSPCDPARLDALLKSLLPEVAQRPGSSVHLWVLGRGVGDTREVADYAFHVRAVPGSMAWRKETARQVEAARSRLTGQLESIEPPVPRRTSPIAEGISKIALFARETDTGWTLVTLSDGYQEMGEFHFECARLPSPAEFIEGLHRELVLTPGTLDRAVVLIMPHDLDEIPRGRCEQTVARGTQVRTLWTEVLEAAGADKVQVRTSIPLAKDVFPLADDRR